MHFIDWVTRFGRIMSVVGLGCLILSGCSTTEGNIALGVGAATVLGGNSPNCEIEQIYYLGVFDPQEQVPPTVYRVRVHGQASFISFTRFASGWVRADLIDSLGSGVEFNKGTGRISITKADSDSLAKLQTGRRLVLFGPEGFREAPKDHRLVIVMGSSPEKFFQAVDESLGVISQAQAEQQSAALDRDLFEALVMVKNERERLDALSKEIEFDLRMRKEVE